MTVIGWLAVLAYPLPAAASPNFLPTPSVSDPETCATAGAQGIVKTFPNGPLDFNGDVYALWRPDGQIAYQDTQTKCVRFLGKYDSETGARNGDNYDAALKGYVLEGKYLETAVIGAAGSPAISRIKRSDNDFRASPGEQIAHFGEAAAYWAITDFRTRVFTDGLIGLLSLDAERAKNLRTRQFRPNLRHPPGYNGPEKIRLAPPLVNLVEVFDPVEMKRSLIGNAISLPFSVRTVSTGKRQFISKAFEPEYVIWGYAALLTKMITRTNTAMLEDPSYASSGCRGNPPSATSCRFSRDITPLLPQALGLYSAALFKGSPDILSYNWWSSRWWNRVPCGERRLESSRCDQGLSLDNVMMFDESVTDPNTPARAVFPFAVPGYANWDSGALSRDTAALFIASLFYYLAHDVGLGMDKSYMLFLKTLSLIGDEHMPGPANLRPLPLRRFARLALQAAAELWPDPVDPSKSIYQEILETDWLLAKGIIARAAFPCNEINEPGCCKEPGPECLPLGDFLTRLDYHLAPGIGLYPANFAWDDRSSYGPVPVPGFGSASPEAQPSSDYDFGRHRVWWNGYKPDFSPPPQYIAYQFHRASRYGPCDYLALSDAPFNQFGLSTERGSMLWQARGDDLSNRVVFFPNQTVYFQRYRQRCESDAQGYYTEDVSPFGFRVIKAVPNGFSFQATRVGFAGGTYLNYRLQPVDPSMTPNDAYRWIITKFGGGLKNIVKTRQVLEPSAANQKGRLVNIVLEKEQPVFIRLERTRSGATEFLEWRERSSDLAREDSQAFYKDLRPTPPRHYGFDRLGDKDWDVIYNHCDPSSADSSTRKLLNQAAATWYSADARRMRVKSLEALVSAEASATNLSGVVDWEGFKWHVNIYSSRERWQQCVLRGRRCAGDVFSHSYNAPSGGSLSAAFGLRDVSRPVYRVEFDIASLPGAVYLQRNTEYVFALHAESDLQNNASLCVMESDVGKTFTIPGRIQPASDLIYLGNSNWNTLYLHREGKGDFSPCRFAYRLVVEEEDAK